MASQGRMNGFVLGCLVAALAAAARPIDAAEVERAMAEATAQREAGECAAALKTLERCESLLPPASRLSLWEVEPRSGRFAYVLPGRRHVYYFRSATRSEMRAAGEADGRPTVNPNSGHSDWKHLVGCIDGASGRRLWVRPIMGAFRTAVDPETDGLLVWGERLLRLAPSTGGIDYERTLAVDGRRVAAVYQRGAIVRATLQYPSRSANVLDMASGKVRPMDLVTGLMMSPDESRILSHTKTQAPDNVTSFVRCLSLDGEKALWEYSRPGYSANPARWLDDDVVWLSGTVHSNAEVARLDGKTGKPRWRYRLPRGAYEPGRESPGDLYDHDGLAWSALGEVAGRVMAVGSEGKLFFLDRETGRPEAVAWPAKTYVGRPAVVGDGLVVATGRRIRSIAPAWLFDRPELNETRVLLLRARCLANLGRADEAWEEIARLLDREPLLAEAWRQRADLARALDRPQYEVAARCRYLELSGEVTSAALRERYGLLKRIPLGSEAYTQPVLLDGTLYLGTRVGDLVAVDTASLTVIARRRDPATLRNLRPYGGVRAYGTDRKYHDFAHLAAWRAEPLDAPKAWFEGPDYGEATVLYREQYYRPLRGGNVRVLNGRAVAEHATAVESIGDWTINVGPGGPIGYGSGGVLALDGNLCPTCWLVRPELPGRRKKVHVRLAVAGRVSVALAATNYERSVLQIWSRDGRTMLRQVEADVMGRTHPLPPKLVPLRGGYLLATTELVWASADPDGPVWRFGVPEAERAGRSDHLREYYTVPVVTGDHVFVGCRDGGLYVFDTAVLAGDR